MQATPSRRIPAPRPGLTETLRRFTAGPGHRCKPFTFLKPHASLQVKKLLGNPPPTGRGKKRTAQNSLSFPAFYLKTNRYERFIFIPLSKFPRRKYCPHNNKGSRHYGNFIANHTSRRTGAVGISGAGGGRHRRVSNLCGTGESRAGGQHLCERERRESRLAQVRQRRIRGACVSLRRRADRQYRIQPAGGGGQPAGADRGFPARLAAR